MSDASNNSKCYEGLRGWLLLWLVLSCFVLIRYIADFDLHMLSEDTWNSLTTSGTEHYHPLSKPLLVFEYFGQFAQIIAVIILIVLCFRKRRFFPKIAITFYLANIVFILVDTFGTLLASSAVKMQISPPWSELVKGFVGIFIWIPCFLKSRRVKATFVS